ncbi:hypothetical protein CPter91_4664 [Collimonas pratensis]|uniref:Uncharacterized protein n=1 Tax=Collimonas pratensis TaxID=279113 RepID=A0A127QA84_9BURK|nr:hypothetical protein CPter91_4664 [Collimonas pratensis]
MIFLPTVFPTIISGLSDGRGGFFSAIINHLIVIKNDLKN